MERTVKRLSLPQIMLRCMSLLLAQLRPKRTGRACPLCPGRSDVNLFRYCQSIIDLDAKVSDGTLDLSMPQ